VSYWWWWGKAGVLFGLADTLGVDIQSGFIEAVGDFAVEKLCGRKKVFIP